MEWLQVAGLTFAALFPLMNPLGALPLFASLTQADTKAFRRQQAIKTAIFAVLILIVFEYAGNAILAFFGLSLGMLQIAGGLIVGHTGWNMSTGTPRVSASEEKELIHGTKKRKRTVARLREAATEAPEAVKELGHKVAELPSAIHPHSESEDQEPAGQAEPARQVQPTGQVDISFSPMAMPMLSGPGAIGVVIGLTAQNPGLLNSIGIVIGIAAMGVLTLICLLLAAPITKALGPSGIMAMQRIFGFIVLGIAVALIAQGLSQVFGITIHG